MSVVDEYLLYVTKRLITEELHERCHVSKLCPITSLIYRSSRSCDYCMKMYENCACSNFFTRCFK